MSFLWPRLLQKCSLVRSAKAMDRDSQRQETSQLGMEAALTRADLDGQRERLAKLTNDVSSLERQLNQVGGLPQHSRAAGMSLDMQCWWPRGQSDCQ